MSLKSSQSLRQGNFKPVFEYYKGQDTHQNGKKNGPQPALGINGLEEKSQQE
jgi:hypothetical protein